MGAASGRLGSARGSRVAESGPLSWTLKIQKIVGEPPNPGRRGHRARRFANPHWLSKLQISS
jgi:hypothetical protein